MCDDTRAMPGGGSPAQCPPPVGKAAPPHGCSVSTGMLHGEARAGDGVHELSTSPFSDPRSLPMTLPARLPPMLLPARLPPVMLPPPMLPPARLPPAMLPPAIPPLAMLPPIAPQPTTPLLPPRPPLPAGAVAAVR